MIPRIIHQIWMQGIEYIPDKYKPYIASIKHYNPTWHYIFWDETAIIQLIRPYGKIVATYYKFSYLHQKIDFAKYVILYLHGGFYIDIDAYAVKSLDDIMERYAYYDMIVSPHRTDKLSSYIACRHQLCINNGVFAARKNSYVANELIVTVMNNPTCGTLSSKYSCIMATTGPSMFTRVIRNNLDKVKVLPWDYLEPCWGGDCDITNRTVIVHVQDLTWIASCLRPLIPIYKHYFYYILLAIIIICVIIYLRTK